MRGELFGALKESQGEVVFNTSHAGYPEVVSDPSYLGQILTFTYPMIGNYGIQEDDLESSKVHASGVVVRQLFKETFHPKASCSFAQFLKKHGVPRISGVDTRMLTRHIREFGSVMGLLAPLEGDGDMADIIDRAKALEGLEGKDLVSELTWESKEERLYRGEGKRGLVVLCDLGAKSGIVRDWLALGFDVLRYIGIPGLKTIESLKPTFVCLSNGPGDPAALGGLIEKTQGLLGRVPIFGICLGHQILALALGAKTQKLRFGHHGVNHPVLELGIGRVEITSQNHCYTVVSESLPEHVSITHKSLYDSTLEGMESLSLGLKSIQFHPEASPGPLDSKPLYQQFLKAIHA
jgi:carbamoyl-phosphate synthase small subunit